MGTTSSIPSKSPLGYILSNWDKFDPKNLKKKRLVFFCNTVWPQYKLGDGEIWPENGNKNYNTILQLDLFCRREGKWSEVPYVQAFMALYRDPSFGSSPTLTKPIGPSVDQLEDTLLSSPPVSQGRLREPQSSGVSAPTLEGATSPPPYAINNLKPPAEEKPSPAGHTRSGASYLPTTPALLPLREVAGPEGAIRVQVPFSITDLQQCKDRLGSFSEDPSRFTSNFQTLTLAFSMSWRDLYIILTTCCSPDEKQRIWEEARKYADQLHTQNPGTNQPAAQAVPDQEPDWGYNTQAGIRSRDAMIDCLLAGMRNCIKKPVNYEKVREIFQGKEENPALFRNRLVEAFQKYTNLDPSSPEGRILIGQHFISQSAPDIRRKLQKLQMGPQTPLDQLMDTAFSVFNNRDLEERKQGKKEREKQAELLALAFSSAIGGNQPHQGSSGRPQKNQGQKDQTCYKCKRPGHWSKNCTQPPPRPCPLYKNFSSDPWHWKVDCPRSHSGKGSSPKAMATLED
ncbi:hypothetical protein HJG60_010498 [Phyllostomus discolor]|uniref:CCHC-type domain-containing protein n=1 Tax=Phyllostomus discolor TaxID=89673 RepID=A0A834EEX8_9CHIR|nr:hypothetical protein HJG60_010498 [Phyllostomus discolor]